MSSTNERTKGLGLLKLARNLAEVGVDAWAKVALVVTSSDAYARMSAAMGRPALFAAAVMRRPAEQAMEQFLAQLQMPSRADVLSLSQRLTRIEMVLDDLSALESMRPAASTQQRTGGRDRPGNGAPGSGAAPARPLAASKEQ